LLADPAQCFSFIASLAGATLPGKFANTDQSKYSTSPPDKTKDGNTVKDGDSMFGNHHYVSATAADEDHLDTGYETAQFFQSSGLQATGAAKTMYPTAICESVNSMAAANPKDHPFEKLLGSNGPRLQKAWESMKKKAEPIGKTLRWEEDGVDDNNIKDGFTLFFARACTTLLNGAKYDRLECEELVLSPMFVNTFPQLTEWILDKYTTIAAMLERFDTELGEKGATDEMEELELMLKAEGLDEEEGSNTSSLHGRGAEHSRRLLNENGLRSQQKYGRLRRAKKGAPREAWEDGSAFPPPQKGTKFTDDRTKVTAMELLEIVRTFAFGFMTDGDDDPFANLAKYNSDPKKYCKSKDGKDATKDAKTPFCRDKSFLQWSGETEKGKDEMIPNMLGDNGWIAKNGKKIVANGLLKKMGDDFKASFGIKAGPKARISTMTGSDYAAINQGFVLIQGNPESYATKYLAHNMEKKQRAIWKGAPPIAEYQFTITLDFESSPPGFCTPSTSMLAVTATVNFRGRTTDAENFNFITGCNTARIHPTNFYLAVTWCSTEDKKENADFFNDAKRKETQDEGVKDLADGNGYYMTIETSAYMLTGSAMDGITKMLEAPLAFLKNAGGLAIGGAAIAAGSSVSRGNSKKGIIGKSILGAVQSTFPFAVSSSILNPPPGAGPIESFAQAMQGGGAIIFTMAMFIKELMAASVGMIFSFENAAKILKDSLDIETVSPIALKMDVILTSSISLEMKWRACRAAEQANWEAQEKVMPKLMETKCPPKLIKPTAATSDLHIMSLNRLELQFAVPFPGGLAKIMPVFGLEVDFDITPVFNAVINYGRKGYAEERRDKCMLCWVGHKRGTRAFCDKRMYVEDWMPKDDVCIDVPHVLDKHGHTRPKHGAFDHAMKKCHDPVKTVTKKIHPSDAVATILASQVPESRLTDFEQKPVFIEAEQFCETIATGYKRVNQDKPPRYLLKPLKRSGVGGGLTGPRIKRQGGIRWDKTSKDLPKVGNDEEDEKIRRVVENTKNTLLIDLGAMGKDIPIEIGTMHKDGIPLQR
jgi:hypothetical protein